MVCFLLQNGEKTEKTLFLENFRAETHIKLDSY